MKKRNFKTVMLNLCLEISASEISRRKKAFTLAEVLITLVIIGVIGALTVPALIQNTQKQEYVSALKKAYSTLSQVTQQIIADEGSPKCKDESGRETGWACSASHIGNMFKKHLNVLKDCGTQNGCFEQLGSEAYPYLNNKPSGAAKLNTSSAYYKMNLADGVQIAFYLDSRECSTNINGSENVCGRIGVDLNGAKKPNKIGRDFFLFALKENGLYPAGCDYQNGYDAGCSSSTYGNACACKVLREDAMNY